MNLQEANGERLRSLAIHNMHYSKIVLRRRHRKWCEMVRNALIPLVFTNVCLLPPAMDVVGSTDEKHPWPSKHSSFKFRAGAKTTSGLPNLLKCPSCTAVVLASPAMFFVFAHAWRLVFAAMCFHNRTCPNKTHICFLLELHPVRTGPSIYLELLNGLVPFFVLISICHPDIIAHMHAHQQFTCHFAICPSHLICFHTR